MLNSTKHNLDMMLRTIFLPELCEQTGIEPVSPQEIMSKIRQTIDAMPDKNNKRRKARLLGQIDSLEVILSLYTKRDSQTTTVSPSELLAQHKHTCLKKTYTIPIEINKM
jgi:hypothetical protein